MKHFLYLTVSPQTLYFIQETEKDGEKNGSVSQVNGHHDVEELNRDDAEPGNGSYAALRSEDSGLGISASPSEQHLPPGMGIGAEGNGIYKEGEGVWRRGGSVDTMTSCLQDILSFITTR